MKIDFRLTPKHCWYPWFAWRPVITRARNGARSIVWLVDIERFDGFTTSYRLPGGE